jgi:hypothetical protein
MTGRVPPDLDRRFVSLRQIHDVMPAENLGRARIDGQAQPLARRVRGALHGNAHQVRHGLGAVDLARSACRVRERLVHLWIGRIEHLRLEQHLLLAPSQRVARVGEKQAADAGELVQRIALLPAAAATSSGSSTGVGSPARWATSTHRAPSRSWACPRTRTQCLRFRQERDRIPGFTRRLSESA